MPSLYLFTFNTGKEFDNTNFYQEIKTSLPQEPADIYVFGFQELTSIMEGAFSTEVSALLNRISKRFVDLLNNVYSTDEFRTVNIVNIGAIGQIIVSASDIRNVRNASTACGMFYSSMKGAVGTRLTLVGESLQDFTFVTCHLCANEGEINYSQRNSNFKSILNNLNFKDGWALLRPNTHCFVMGDLNYRVRGDGLINDFSKDELTLARNNGDAWWKFDEAPVQFPPTYKYFVGSENEFNPKRIPSWCDRILFQSYNGQQKVIDYNSLTKVVSDHRAVYLNITIPGPVSCIDSEGYIEGTDIYVRPSFKAKAHEIACIVADGLIGWGLYGSTTTRGRIVMAIALVLLLIFWFI